MLQAAARVSQGLQAPLFEQLIRGLDEEQRHVIFDCGAARGGTIDLLSSLRCRLEVLDLAEVLPRLDGLEEPELRRELMAARLAQLDQEPGKLVLCWNLLDYLQPDDIAVLAKLLALRLSAGARLHALFEYSSPTMPALPGHWVPDASARLHADQPTVDEIPAPRYSPKTLERLMPQFRSERSVLLGNGLREHLFQLRA